MGVFGLVNGQWKFFPNAAAAQAAGAVNVRKQPPGEGTPRPGAGPPNPRMYWDEMTGQWRFPQPDGSTPGAMPSFGVPPGSPVLSPFPPGGSPIGGGTDPWYGKPPLGFTQKPGPATMALVEWRNPATGETWTAPNGGWQGPPGWVSGGGGRPAPIDTGPPQGQPFPPNDNIGIPIDGPPSETKNPFEDYVRKYPDLMEAYKKHKSKGGKGDAASWGKLHFERHGQKEKRKVPGLHGPVTINGTPPPSASVGTPVNETKPTPNWDKYLSSNPDLMKAFGTDVAKAKQHWAQFGSKEKRKFTPY
jgi:hypothetical protein